MSLPVSADILFLSLFHSAPLQTAMSLPSRSLSSLSCQTVIKYKQIVIQVELQLDLCCFRLMQCIKDLCRLHTVENLSVALSSNKVSEISVPNSAVLTKLYSALESSMSCPAVRTASTLFRPTVRRKPSSSRAEASVTASTRVKVSCMNTIQSTTSEPVYTYYSHMHRRGTRYLYCT